MIAHKRVEHRIHPLPLLEHLSPKYKLINIISTELIETNLAEDPQMLFDEYCDRRRNVHRSQYIESPTRAAKDLHLLN